MNKEKIDLIRSQIKQIDERITSLMTEIHSPYSDYHQHSTNLNLVGSLNNQKTKLQDQLKGIS